MYVCMCICMYICKPLRNKTRLDIYISARKEGLPGGVLVPLFLSKLPYVPMFPNVFLVCSPFNKFAYHAFTL